MKQPYHPTSKQPLATEADFARMQRVLDKHAAPKPHVPQPEPDVPRETKPPLEWEPLPAGATGYYDTTKRYSVCEITISGHKLYSAWKLAGAGAWFTDIGVGLKSWAEAENRCQADASRVKP